MGLLVLFRRSFEGVEEGIRQRLSHTKLPPTPPSAFLSLQSSVLCEPAQISALFPTHPHFAQILELESHTPVPSPAPQSRPCRADWPRGPSALLLSTTRERRQPRVPLVKQTRGNQASRVVVITFVLTYTITAKPVKMCDAHTVCQTLTEGLLLSLVNSQCSGAGEGAGRDHHEEGAIAVLWPFL